MPLIAASGAHPAFVSFDPPPTSWSTVVVKTTEDRIWERRVTSRMRLSPNCGRLGACWPGDGQDGRDPGGSHNRTAVLPLARAVGRHGRNQPNELKRPRKGNEPLASCHSGPCLDHRGRPGPDVERIPYRLPVDRFFGSTGFISRGGEHDHRQPVAVHRAPVSRDPARLFRDRHPGTASRHLLHWCRRGGRTGLNLREAMRKASTWRMWATWSFSS